MYSPVYICGVKPSTVGLQIIDRQIKFSMTLEVQGTVDLFRLVERGRCVYSKLLEKNRLKSERS